MYLYLSLFLAVFLIGVCSSFPSRKSFNLPSIAQVFVIAALIAMLLTVCVAMVVDIGAAKEYVVEDTILIKPLNSQTSLGNQAYVGCTEFNEQPVYYYLETDENFKETTLRHIPVSDASIIIAPGATPRFVVYAERFKNEKVAKYVYFKSTTYKYEFYIPPDSVLYASERLLYKED